MKLIKVCLEVILLYTMWCFSVISAKRATSNYYHWEAVRDEIPACAVPGGKNKNGTTFMGQFPFREVLIPGEIHSSPLEIIYVTWGDVYVSNNNFKVLCSEYPQNFEWIQTTLKRLRFLTDKHLVQGGHDDGYPLLIGKIRINDEEFIGKVTIYEKYNSFAFVSYGKSYYKKDVNTDIFSVLAFNQPYHCNEVHVKVYY